MKSNGGASFLPLWLIKIKTVNYESHRVWLIGLLLSVFSPDLNDNQISVISEVQLEWIIQPSHFNLSDLNWWHMSHTNNRCRWFLVTEPKGKEKDLSPLNLMRCHWCGNTSSIAVYRRVLVELYPSSSPLGSCSHGRRAGTSGTLPVARAKEYEGCIQPACNFICASVSSAFRDSCCILGYSLSIS